MTKSRKTSRRGSTTPSPIDFERRTLRTLLAQTPVRPQGRLVEHRDGGEDPDPGTNGKREGIGWTRVDLDGPPVTLEHDRGVERLLGQLGDHHPIDLRAELLQRRREQVMGQRSLGGKALEFHGDRARFPRSDPDREVAIAVELLEDHDVAAREHVDPDALDLHLDKLVVHGRIIPRRSDSPAEPSPAG